MNPTPLPRQEARFPQLHPNGTLADGVDVLARVSPNATLFWSLWQ